MAPLPAAFGAVVVTNYLYRPLMPALLDAVEPGGVLLYQTFMEGNERFGRPTNPRSSAAATANCSSWCAAASR